MTMQARRLAPKTAAHNRSSWRSAKRRKETYTLGSAEVEARRQAALTEIAQPFGGVSAMLQQIADGTLDVVYLEIEEDSDEHVLESLRQAFADIEAGRIHPIAELWDALKRDD